MEFKTDLHRVIWHEFGHLFIDIYMTTVLKEYSVDNVFFEFHNEAISTFKWGGGVSTIPTTKYESFSTDADRCAFALLSLISGCVFQTFFLTEINKSEAKFSDCFGHTGNCAGKSDHRSFFQICTLHRQAYGRSDGFIKFTEIDLPDMFFESLKKNELFINRLNELSLKYLQIISNDYEACKNKDNYSFGIAGDSLTSLLEEVKLILNETKITATIAGIKELIATTIREDISKKLV